MKLSAYTNLIKKDEYFILHNPMYNKMIKVFSSQLKNVCTNIIEKKIVTTNSFFSENEKDFLEALKDNKMIVPDNHNEINILNYMYELYQINSKNLSLIIMPTMQCNFACPYCYEKHFYSSMADATYDNILSYIRESVEKNNTQSIAITWFGGEPILENKKIIKFMNNLKEKVKNDIIINSHMTTNGYLLDFENFENLVESGVTEFQITIDGPKEFHNKTRLLKDLSGTWDKIINNLKSFKKSSKKFHVIIRTNFTKELFDIVDEWFQYLSDTFGDDYRFTYHFETVKDLGGENKEYIYNDNLEFESIIEKKATMYNLNTSVSKSIYTFSMLCYASSHKNLIIYYNGDIKKCTSVLYSEKNDLGKIKDNGILDLDLNNISNWTSYNINTNCYKCKIYPICFGRKCPNVKYDVNYCNTLISTYEASVLNKF